ncbi:hypothetical protein EDD16DRAFT_1654598 [Pisolithus croceorrhizus]|nr:hypothetical protein EDD16DRAFT_1654598 [Pisolithus croceorrhizus]
MAISVVTTIIGLGASLFNAPSVQRRLSPGSSAGIFVTTTHKNVSHPGLSAMADGKKVGIDKDPNDPDFVLGRKLLEKCTSILLDLLRMRKK